MIGRLCGKVIDKKPPLLLIDVNGVGYEVYASMNTFYKLPETDQQVLLHTHLITREDAQNLYGFYDEHERSLFRALIKVNGVGPKMALAVLSSIAPDKFVGCVNDHDVASLVRIPGVGKKTAERLIIEMRDRLADWQFTDATALNNRKDVLSKGVVIQDAISALMALGYKAVDASRMVANVYREGLASEQVIRLALQSL
jgi:Holliday junction DNA helicase RuvA